MRRTPRARRRVAGGCVALLALAWLVGSAALQTAEATDVPALDAFHRDRILERAARLPRLRSLLVSVGGELIEEHYFNGASARRSANLKSASKTIIAILVGIAIDRGYLEGVDQPIVDFFPDELAEADAGQAFHNHRRPAHHAVGPADDFEPQLRPLGAEPSLGAGTR